MSDGDDEDVDCLHEFDDGHGRGQWDQFETNEHLFGVTTTDFNEDFYTTKLDRNSGEYRLREKEAVRLAREIESVRQPSLIRSVICVVIHIQRTCCRRTWSFIGWQSAERRGSVIVHELIPFDLSVVMGRFFGSL